MMTELETILSIDYKTLVLINVSAAVLGISLLVIALWLGSKTPSARSHPLFAMKSFGVIALIVAGLGGWFASTTQARIGYAAIPPTMHAQSLQCGNVSCGSKSPIASPA
jgi:hypothetical protein